MRACSSIRGSQPLHASMPPRAALALALTLLSRAAAQLSVAGTVTSHTQLDGPWGIAVSGSYVYAALYDSHGLAIVDVSSSSSPSIAGVFLNATFLLRARYVALNADATFAYVTADTFFTVIDVSTKSSPTFAGVYYHAYLNDAMQLAVSTTNPNHVFVVSYWSDSLFCIDVSNPGDPTLVSYFRDTVALNRAWGIALTSALAYVCTYDSWNSKLVIIDIGNPAAMELRSYAINPPSTYMMRSARSVALSSTYAFVAGYHRDSLAVVDVADSIAPNATWRIQSSSRLDGVLELFLSGDLLYALSPLDNMLTVLDVSSPTQPTVSAYIANVNFNGAQGMAKLGDYAYITSRTRNSLTVVNVPTAPGPSPGPPPGT